MESKLEVKEELRPVETVRVALFHRGKFLVLKKSSESKTPQALEFPGGKIDEIAGTVPTLEEQERTAVIEIQQETGLDISQFPLEKIDDFEIFFETIEGGIKNKHKRNIHLFLVRLPEIMNFIPQVNQTRNEQGGFEDNHESYAWTSSNELIKSVTLLEENPITKEKKYPLSKNSRHIKKLLQATGLKE